MKCGEQIQVRNFYRTNTLRFIAMCHGQFMQISNSLDWNNGFILQDWHYVLRELVAAAVPAKLIEKAMAAESTASGLYVYMPLTYPLSAKALADLLGVPVDEVREQLADLAIEVD